MKTLSLLFSFTLLGSPLFATDCLCVDCKCTQEEHCGCMASNDNANDTDVEEDLTKGHHSTEAAGSTDADQENDKD